MVTFLSNGEFHKKKTKRIKSINLNSTKLQNRTATHIYKPLRNKHFWRMVATTVGQDLVWIKWWKLKRVYLNCVASSYCFLHTSKKAYGPRKGWLVEATTLMCSKMFQMQFTSPLRVYFVSCTLPSFLLGEIFFSLLAPPPLQRG